MATTIAAPRATPAAAGAYDRAFYSTMAIVMALVVFAGFAPTYYLRAFVEAPVTVSGSTTLTPLAHVHGAIFTLWVLLFIVQTALVAQRKVALHRRLGIAGAVLAAVMVVVGTVTALAAAGRGTAPPGADPLEFLIVPLGDLVLFTGFVAAALARRRDRETHKRLMLLAYISIIIAAVARLPGVPVMAAFFGGTLALVLAGVAYDLVTRRRIHPVYLWGGGLLLASGPARLVLSGTAPWRSFAEWTVQSLIPYR